MLTSNNIRGLTRQLLLLLLLAAMCSSVRAQAATLDVGYQGQEQADFVSLASHFAVLEDSSQRLSLSDVLRPEVAARFQQDPHRKTDLHSAKRQPSASWHSRRE